MKQEINSLDSNLTPQDVEWAYREVERQHDLSAEHVSGMCEALIHARMHHPAPITIEFVKQLNWCIKGIGRFRNINLAFPPDAPRWEFVERQMEIWCENTDNQLANPYEVTYRFLKIHPFIDGNGRVAALIYNITAGHIHDSPPCQLPDWEILKSFGSGS